MKSSPSSPRYQSVILAGGASRRMGQDKALIRVAGQRLVDIVYARISAQCDNVLISGKNDYGLDLETLPDRPEGPSGPVGGIYTVWERLRGQATLDGFVTIPIDGPNLPLDFCQKMVGQTCSVSVTSDGVHPTFAYWNMTRLTKVFKVLDFSRSQSLKSLATLCEARKVMWPDARMFYNINTPHDLSDWKKSHENLQE